MSAVFKNASAAATDPTTLTFKYRKPDGVVTTVGPMTLPTVTSPVVKDSTGNFHADVTVDQAGLWAYRFEGTGDVAQGEEVEFRVDRTNF